MLYAGKNGPILAIQKGYFSRYIINPNPITMSELKVKVNELFLQDQQLNALEKDIKVKNAHYHHLLLKNSEKIYSDEEVIAVNKIFEELSGLESQRANFRSAIKEIKDYLKSKLSPLGGGRWVHLTEDPIHPRWEFWVEDDELKFARLNGAAY